METSFSTLLVSFMVDIVLLAGVPLGIATLSGLVVSFFQAVTQIQDQTLSQTVKISAVVITLLILGPSLVSPLMTSTVEIFDNFHLLAQ